MFTKLRIISVGKTSNEYQILFDHYTKLINSNLEFKIIPPENHLPKEKQIENNSKNILDLIENHKNEFWVILAIKGKNYNSEDFCDILSNYSSNYKRINFIIGGSYGLSDEVENSCGLLLSFSKMTLPHQLAKIILLEQIYRAESIIKNSSYHK